MHFQWINVVFGVEKLYTLMDKIRVSLFAAMHISFLLILIWSSNSYIMAQVLSLALQSVATGLSIIAFATLEEYADKMTNAIQLEQTQNPILLACVTIRCFGLIHALLHSSYYLVFFFLIEVMYTASKCTDDRFFVDATTAWKDLRKLRFDRRIRIIYNAFLFLAVILNMIYKFASTPM